MNISANIPLADVLLQILLIAKQLVTIQYLKATQAYASEASRLEPIEQQIAEVIPRSRVVHFDETGLQVGGKKHWLHVACTLKHTNYTVDPLRGLAGLKHAGILPNFREAAVHDG